MPSKLIFAAWMFWITRMIATTQTATTPMSRARPLLILTVGLRRAGLGGAGWKGTFPLAKGGGSVLVALGVLDAAGWNASETAPRQVRRRNSPGEA